MMTLGQIDDLDRILGTIERIVRMPSPSPLQLEQATHAVVTARAMLPGRVPIAGTDLIVVDFQKRRMSMPEILASLPFVVQPIIPEAHEQPRLHNEPPPPAGVEAAVPRGPEPPSEE